VSSLVYASSVGFNTCTLIFIIIFFFISGASSLFGLYTELGPLLLDDRSLQTDEYTATGVPTPIYNENAWTRLGHLLIIDQPAPVGFSYCNEATDSHSCDGLSWTDELAAANSYAALQQFYTVVFPCLASKDLYLTGESYAGIYVPTLARTIMHQRGAGVDAALDDSFGTLKGFAVGDGCLGTETSVCMDLSDPEVVDLWSILFLAGHGQVPLSTYRQVLDACNVANDDSEDPLDVRITSTSKVCQEALQKVKKEVGGFYEYSLYDDCTYRNGLMKTKPGFPRGGIKDYACGGDIVMTEYIGLPEVQDALHVESEFFAVDNADGFDYTPTEKDLTGFYKEINGVLRVLIYNGDTDPAITSFAAQNWTSHLGFKESEEWRPWTVDGCRRMGGYVQRYEGDFDFLTIVSEYLPA
jgi:carboxypeptidase C (cathepsin A)